MESYNELEVDVNGHEIFLVDKKILASFSGRISRLFGKSKGTKKNLKTKVIFYDFPGGAEGFELISRFCYNNGRTDITPSNVFLLNSASGFMEINGDSHGVLNLMSQTEKYLEGIQFWTWWECISCLKQCQGLLSVLSSSHFLHKVLNCLVERSSLPCASSSPRTSSSDNSSFQFSGDISTNSSKNYNSPATWWFEDLIFLNTNMFEQLRNANSPRLRSICLMGTLLIAEKVAGLIDMYMVEVAPDPYLNTTKFVALTFALPHFARDSHDRLHQAMDIYLEVHSNLCEEEKERVLFTELL